MDEQQWTLMDYIMDQPRALKSLRQNYQISSNPMVELFRKYPIKKVYMVGSGTSYHASFILKKYFAKYLSVDVSVIPPKTFALYETINLGNHFQKDEILVIALSQSGTSFSTISAVKKAKDAGFRTVVLTDAIESPITAFADLTVKLLSGVEWVPPETRGYTVAVLTLYLWALDIALALGKIETESYSGRLLEIDTMISHLPSVIEASKDYFERNKYELLMMQKGDVGGYGINYATALEAALKVGECFHRKVVGSELEEILHGPEMGFDDNNYLFMIRQEASEAERVSETADFCRPITKHVFIINADPSTATEKDFVFPHQTTDDLSPIFMIIPFHIYAALATEAVGIDTRLYPHKLYGHGLGHKQL